MARRHVQRLEVEPVGLHLGAFGDGEAEPDEHVLEPLPRLRHRVLVAAPGRRQVLGEVESLGGDASVERLRTERSAARSERSSHFLGRLVECPSGGLALIGILNGTERGLQRCQRAAFAEQFLVETDHVVERSSSADHVERRFPGGADVVDHESLFRGGAVVRNGVPG